MELRQIAFDRGNLRFNIEANRGGSYSVDIQYTTDKGETWENLGHFRTDEVDVSSMIDGLDFFRNYNFIQEK